MMAFVLRTLLSTLGTLLLVGTALGSFFSLPAFRLPNLDARLSDHRIQDPEMRRYAQAVELFVQLSADRETARLQAVRESERWRACLTPTQVATVLEAVVVTPIRQGKYGQYNAFVQRLHGSTACPRTQEGKPLFPP